MKKHLLFLLSLSIITLTLSAQHNKKDFIYLKNGAVVSGNILSLDPSGIVQIESGDNILIYQVTEIDSIRQQKSPPKIFNPDKKLFFGTQFGFLVGNSSNEQKAPFVFHGSVDFTIISGLSAGIGAGVETFDETYLPVFTNLQLRLRNTKFTPVFFTKIGYQVPLEKKHSYLPDNRYYYPTSYIPYYTDYDLKTKGGFIINPGFGILIMSDSNLGYGFSFGYRYHRLSFEGENGYSLDQDFHRISITFNIIFN